MDCVFFWIKFCVMHDLICIFNSQQPRAVNVDLQNDAMLQVDISDALSERDKVKFTVHTKVCVDLLFVTHTGIIRLVRWLNDSLIGWSLCLYTQSTLPNFKQNEFSVVRQHEEFIWLHDSFVENEDYAGYIVRHTHTHSPYFATFCYYVIIFLCCKLRRNVFP